MTLFSTLALAGAMFLLAATPGPGVFATVARSLASGFGHAAVVVAGIVTGDLLFLLLAIFGLASFAGLLGEFFLVVKIAGGLYLLWLGYRIWRQRPGRVEIPGVRELSWKQNFLSGLVITLGNPKVILFYLGFLPTFMDLAALDGGDVVIVAAVVSVVLGGVMLAYAWSAARARELFRSSRAKRIMNRTAGGVMMTTGSVLIIKS
ncbi:MAG: LysE family translocator [Gammaproteobacteria bacterium]|jgi:threonine/homoserine/homoserine lactone efflux protein